MEQLVGELGCPVTHEAYDKGPRPFQRIAEILQKNGTLPELQGEPSLAEPVFNRLVRENFVFGPSKSLRRLHVPKRQTTESIGYEGRKCTIPNCPGIVKGIFSSSHVVSVTRLEKCCSTAHSAYTKLANKERRKGARLPYKAEHLTMLPEIRDHVVGAKPVVSIMHTL